MLDINDNYASTISPFVIDGNSMFLSPFDTNGKGVSVTIFPCKYASPEI